MSLSPGTSTLHDTTRHCVWRWYRIFRARPTDLSSHLVLELHGLFTRSNSLTGHDMTNFRTIFGSVSQVWGYLVAYASNQNGQNIFFKDEYLNCDNEVLQLLYSLSIAETCILIVNFWYFGQWNSQKFSELRFNSTVRRARVRSFRIIISINYSWWITII